MSTRAPSCGNYDWAKLKLQYTNLQTNVGHGQCYTVTPKTNVGHGQCYTATPKLM